MTKREKYVELPAELKDLEIGNEIRKENIKGIIDYLQDYIDHRAERGDPRGTYKEFISLKNRLSMYENANSRKLTFEDVNLPLADELLSYWLKEKYHPNTIKKSFLIFKTFLNYYYLRKDDLKINLSNKFQLKEFG